MSPVCSLIFSPVSVIEPGLSRFFLRNSSGSMPIVCATSSMWRSRPQKNSTWPKPRYAVP